MILVKNAKILMDMFKRKINAILGISYVAVRSIGVSSFKNALVVASIAKFVMVKKN